MRAFLIIFAVLILTGGGAFLLLQNRTDNPVQQTEPQDYSAQKQETPKKSAHYESNAPEHGAVLAGVPINVIINFNFDLAKGSNIRVYSSGVKNPVNGTTSPIDATSGETTIDENRISMRRNLDPKIPNDIYTVEYNACWADGSCHSGNFQFKIDKSQASEFTDMTGQKEVTVNMENYSFSPMKIKVSKGTKITWTNKDSVVHTVNTDSHPAHTYYPSQNSRDLKSGDSYVSIFTNPGIYLYHCTPHANNMKGQILVE